MRTVENIGALSPPGSHRFPYFSEIFSPLVTFLHVEFQPRDLILFSFVTVRVHLTRAFNFDGLLQVRPARAIRPEYRVINYPSRVVGSSQLLLFRVKCHVAAVAVYAALACDKIIAVPRDEIVARPRDKTVATPPDTRKLR